MRWLRRHEIARAQAAAKAMDRAWIYLWEDFEGWASTRSRDGLTPPQWEALHILNRSYREALCRALEVSL